MYWVAIENVGTCEFPKFEKATEKEVLYLLDEYSIDKNNPTNFSMQGTENGKRVIYEGDAYKGEFGYNLLVARKYIEA